MIVRRTSFIAPCQPSKAARPPSGPLWVHEIKHDGYRLMVRRDNQRIRCFTRNGDDWADRFLSIVDAAQSIKATSFLIDGEVVIVGDDGTPDFRALRSRSREAMLVAFDLLQHDGRDLPLAGGAVALTHPKSIDSTVLGSEWQCHKIAFVITTCALRTQSRAAPALDNLVTSITGRHGGWP